ncbi:hypothetical protein CEP54_011265 [Fusarium duplospermum]|uniref:Uncharacterized protein n=1 Tax=Fusarium duplospermum TaxID=1325734 RepID=A0A428PFC2_9HYPO|nr:hypothetical protein CEP54_011265 [Fusarium duplospermum]
MSGRDVLNVGPQGVGEHLQKAAASGVIMIQPQRGDTVLYSVWGSTWRSCAATCLRNPKLQGKLIAFQRVSMRLGAQTSFKAINREWNKSK